MMMSDNGHIDCDNEIPIPLNGSSHISPLFIFFYKGIYISYGLCIYLYSIIELEGDQ